MKRYPGIKYNQRPASYWLDQDVLTSILRNVKGRERRAMIRAYWKEGRLEELDEVLLRDALSEAERESLGRIHPAFMGGEYLPDYQEGEVEIARISLRSVTADVISIRAVRRDEQEIGYRIVDEYGTEFSLAEETSSGPFTLAGLIGFIEGSSHPDLPGGLALGYNEMNAADSHRGSLRHFTSITSEFYPQLYDHFEAVFADWVAEEEETPTPEEQD